MRIRTLSAIAVCLLLSLTAWGKTSRIKNVGEYPNFLALSPDGRIAYVTSFGTSEVLAVDLAQKAVTKSAVVGTSPLGISVTSDGKLAVIACKDSGTVSFLNLDTFRVEADINTSGAPNAVAIDPKGYRAFVTNFGRSKEGNLHIVDIRQRSVEANVTMGMAPIAVAVSPVTDLVYVVNGGSNEVWVVNPEKKAVTTKITVGEAPDGIAITPDGNRIFVSNSRSNDVSVIDTQLGKVVVTIPVGKRPFGITVSPDGKRVFVVNTESRTVSILPADLTSLQAQSFNVEKGPVDIEVAPDNRTVLVVNEQSHSLTVADMPQTAGGKQ